MKARGIHLQYGFAPTSQAGAQIDNPLFELLSALREHGSIRNAAAARGLSYRHTWGAIRHWEDVLGESLVHWVQGQPARLTPFAERLLWAETQARTRLTPHIEALRAELERVLSDALDGRQEVLTIWASHDMALPLLREVASGRHRLHMDLRFTGSVDALRALSQGRCLVAGFHVPAPAAASAHFARTLKPLLKPGRHKLVGCFRRVQGLMLRPQDGPRVRALRDLCGTGLRFVNRQQGSGTRLLLEHLMQADGLQVSSINGWLDPPEESHLAVASAVAGGLADCGPGIQAAAQAFGLGFHPLMHEDYYLVCLKDALEHPAVLRLCSALQAPEWARALQRLPGYEPSPDAGLVLPLTRALPWWHYRSGKASQCGPAFACGQAAIPASVAVQEAPPMQPLTAGRRPR